MEAEKIDVDMYFHNLEQQLDEVRRLDTIAAHFEEVVRNVPSEHIAKYGISVSFDLDRGVVIIAAGREFRAKRSYVRLSDRWVARYPFDEVSVQVDGTTTQNPVTNVDLDGTGALLLDRVSNQLRMHQKLEGWDFRGIVRGVVAQVLLSAGGFEPK